MQTAAITQLVKMVEILPEATQNQIVDHLQAYIQELQNEKDWDELVYHTQPKLVQAAQVARKQIRDGLSTPMDESKL